MKRAFHWVLVVVGFVGFAASFSELQRMRGRFGEATRHHIHDHQDARQFMIRAALADLHQPIVVIGDSITEMAKLPEAIGDKPVVNAGISGATISDFFPLVPRILDGARPSLCAIALGANDVGSSLARLDYAALLLRLKTLCPSILAFAVTPMNGSDMINTQIRAAALDADVPFVEMPLPDGSTLADHIHLNTFGYRTWIPALVAAISKQSRPKLVTGFEVR
jgi:hypothetical protein